MEGTFIWKGRLYGRDIYMEGTFIWKGRLYGRDIYLESCLFRRDTYLGVMFEKVRSFVLDQILIYFDFIRLPASFPKTALLKCVL